MKRLTPLLVIILLAGFSIPSITAAQDVYQCDVGSIQCLCPPDVGVGDLGEAGAMSDPATAQTACQTVCRSAASNPLAYGTVTNYKLQCTIEGVLTPLLDNPLEDPGEGLAEESFVAPPRLGIDIPGFDPQLSDSFFGGETFESNVLGLYVRAVYGWLISAGAIVAVLMIMIGGVQYAMAAGNPSGIGQAKERITNAVVGLVLLMSAFTIAFLIDPDTVAFETLTLKYIDPVEYIELSNDLAGQLAVGPGSPGGTAGIPAEILCDPSYPIDEIAISTIGNITYRYGAKGGPPPYGAEDKVDPNGVPYSSYCPEGTLCFDCSGYADFLRTCAGLPPADETGGTTGIFGENCSASENVETWDESGVVNGVPMVPGDLVGRPGEHVLVYIGNGQVADAHGSGRPPGEGVGIFSISYVFNDLPYDPPCLRRR